MKKIVLLIATAGLASCTTAPNQPMRTAERQAAFDRMLAGKVAGKPMSCLPPYLTTDMQVIDESTLLFRQTQSKVYVAHMKGACANVGSASYALVTKQYGSQGLCNGDIAQVVDTSTGMLAGSCVVGDFVPYTNP